MSGQMQLTDEVRLNILETLLDKGSVSPNLRQLKRRTGYHLATIKGSLEFLKKEGLLEGFGPKVNFRKLGYKLESIVLIQADLSEEKVFKKFLDAVKGDPFASPPLHPIFQFQGQFILPCSRLKRLHDLVPGPFCPVDGLFHAGDLISALHPAQPV